MRETLQRETLFVHDDRYRLGLLLVVAALGGVGVGFGLATMAYNTRMPPLARVAPFDLGPSATPSLLGRGDRARYRGDRHRHRRVHVAAECESSLAAGPRLGVRLQSLDVAIGRSLEVPADVERGAVVTWVFRGTPAHAAGIEAGDVIVAVGDEPIDDASDLVRAIRAARVGQAVELTVVRGGEHTSLSATLAGGASNDNRG